MIGRYYKAMDSNKQFIRDMPMAKRIAWLYHCSNFFRTSVDKLINEAIERLEEVKIGSLAELVSNAPDSSAGMVALPNVEAQRWEGLAPKAGSAADVTSPDIRCSAWLGCIIREFRALLRSLFLLFRSGPDGKWYEVIGGMLIFIFLCTATSRILWNIFKIISHYS